MSTYRPYFTITDNRTKTIFFCTIISKSVPLPLEIVSKPLKSFKYRATKTQNNTTRCRVKLFFFVYELHHITYLTTVWKSKRNISKEINVRFVLCSQKWYAASSPSSETLSPCPATWPFSTVTYPAWATTRTTCCPNRWPSPRGCKTACSTYSRRGRSVSRPVFFFFKTENLYE